MRAIVAQASFTDQPLAELKAWLAISGTRDDAVLHALLAAANVMCEHFTGIFAWKTTAIERLAASVAWQPTRSRPWLNHGPVEAIAADGSARLLGQGDYEVEIVDQAARIRLVTAIAEPQLAITLTLGMTGTWSELDPGLRHGLIRYAAHQYRERDSGEVSALPAAVVALWRPFRRVGL